MSEPGRTVVLVLEGTFPRQGGGGAESQVLTLGRCLKQRGVHVIVVAPRVKDGPQALRETLDGFEIVRIPYPRVHLVGGLVMLARLFAMLVARRAEYAVIHAHIAHNMAAASVLAGRLVRKPVFVKITGLHEMKGGILDARPGWASRLRRALLRNASSMQATSSRIGALLVERGFAPERVALVPNGVDTARFSTRARDEALRRELCGEAARVGIFVGRLSAEKGHAMLLEAWARAFAPAANARLLLVGEGPMREALTAHARALGIEEQVVFAGHRGDVARILPVADFALLTSEAEGLSNALLEYMAAGLPVVGSRVSGTEDFVVHGRNGWLFEPRDGEGLAIQLRVVGATPREELARLGREARARVQALASLDAVTDTLLRLYGINAAGAAALARAA